MVGLSTFGEAAWSIEETLNVFIADERPAHGDLRALVDYAIRYLDDWASDLRTAGRSARLPDAMIEAARAVRVGQAVAPSLRVVTPLPSATVATDAQPTVAAPAAVAKAASVTAEPDATVAGDVAEAPLPVLDGASLAADADATASSSASASAPTSAPSYEDFDRTVLLAREHSERPNGDDRSTPRFGDFDDDLLDLEFFGEQPRLPDDDTAVLADLASGEPDLADVAAQRSPVPDLSASPASDAPHDPPHDGDQDFAKTMVLGGDDDPAFAKTLVLADDDPAFAQTLVLADDDPAFAQTIVLGDDDAFAKTLVLTDDVDDNPADAIAPELTLDEAPLDFAFDPALDASRIDAPADASPPSSDDAVEDIGLGPGDAPAGAPADAGRTSADVVAPTMHDVAASRTEASGVLSPIDRFGSTGTQADEAAGVGDAAGGDRAGDVAWATAAGDGADAAPDARAEAEGRADAEGDVDADEAEREAPVGANLLASIFGEAPVAYEHVAPAGSATDEERAVGSTPSTTPDAPVAAVPSAQAVEDAAPFATSIDTSRDDDARLARMRAASADETRRIGPLTLSLTLFNIYLGEADELLRVLTLDFAAWRLELDRFVSEGAMRAAHSLSGSSATVGLEPAHQLASGIEEVLQQIWREPTLLTEAQVVLLQEAVESLHRMLHRFAAERMPDRDTARVDALKALRHVLAGETVSSASPREALPAATVHEARDSSATVDEPDIALDFGIDAPIAVASDAGATADRPDADADADADLYVDVDVDVAARSLVDDPSFDAFVFDTAMPNAEAAHVDPVADGADGSDAAAAADASEGADIDAPGRSPAGADRDATLRQPHDDTSPFGPFLTASEVLPSLDPVDGLGVSTDVAVDTPASGADDALFALDFDVGADVATSADEHAATSEAPVFRAVADEVPLADADVLDPSIAGDASAAFVIAQEASVVEAMPPSHDAASLDELETLADATASIARVDAAHDAAMSQADDDTRDSRRGEAHDDASIGAHEEASSEAPAEMRVDAAAPDASAGTTVGPSTPPSTDHEPGRSIVDARSDFGAGIDAIEVEELTGIESVIGLVATEPVAPEARATADDPVAAEAHATADDPATVDASTAATSVGDASMSDDAPVAADAPDADAGIDAGVDASPSAFEAQPVDAHLAAAKPVAVESGIRDEIDPDLLEVFLAEGAEILPAIGERLRVWQHDPSNKDAARLLLRHLHTLKGSARMAGAMRLGEVVHDIEARVESAQRLHEVPPALLEELFVAHDRSLELFDALHRPVAAPLDATTAALAAPVSDADAEVDTDAAAADAPVDRDANASVDGAAASRETPRVRDGKSRQQAVRVASETLDRLVNLAGEVSISRARVENEVAQIKSALADLGDNVERLRGQLREIELQAEFQLQSQMQSQSTGRERETFDPLEFDRFTRFQELTRMMAESVNDVKTVHQNLHRSLDAAEVDLSSQRRMTRDLQQDLMRVRMVPFSSVAERLYRVARRAAKEVDKRVNLDILGGSVEIDRGVLERMAGPFEHLLRNHIVHGIETRDARAAAGKDETGELLIEVRQEGNEMVLTFSDDGAGLDLDRIRAKATALGLVRGDETVSDAAAAELIFHPGFSTAEQVTELAGRGVGMDVVRAEAMVLAGRVSVDSVRGRGTRFTIHLPLTLAVTQVVLVSVGGRAFALPAVLVEQVQQLKPQPLADAYRSGHLAWLGAPVRLAFLGSLLEIDDSVPVAQRTSPVLVLRSGGERIAVHVDEVLGNQEVVVKNLGPQLSRMAGIVGATVLGSGEIVLILNPVQLAAAWMPPAAVDGASATAVVDVAVEAGASPSTAVASAPRAVALQTLPTVMVVDDSLTVRRVTQRLLSREGYQVVLAKDGVDALEQLQDFAPDAMLVDIEMPRMDGFDLTRNVRNDPRFRGIPILMITSRTAEKHRQYAIELGVDEYLGKPYQEDELLEKLARHVAAGRREIATH